jgi:hypothetical protein
VVRLAVKALAIPLVSLHPPQLSGAVLAAAVTDGSGWQE